MSTFFVESGSSRLELSTTDQAIFDADDIRSVIYPTHDRPLPLFAHATRGAYAGRDRDYIANSRSKHFHAVSTGSKNFALRTTIYAKRSYDVSYENLLCW